MFQFTTTTVINQNKDASSNGKLFEGAAGFFKIKRGNNFKKSNVVGIYKRIATDPKFDKATFDLSSLARKAGIYRIALYVRLSGSNNSYFANDFVFKGKPFYIEFTVGATEDAPAIAKKVVSIAKKYFLLVYEKDLFKFSDSTNNLVIEALDEYQRFTKADIEKLTEDTNALTSTFKHLLSASVVAGAEGFGTYNYVVKNLRLPTAARTGFANVNQDENPIPGAKYNEYIIHYCVDRGVMGGDAVGDTVTSRTTHVFYVNQTVSSEFETALNNIGTATEVTDGSSSAGLTTYNSLIDALEKRVAELEAAKAHKA